MKKKITAIGLSALMTFSVMPMSAFSAFAEGTTPTEITASYDWYSTPTDDVDVYEIDTIGELAGLAKLTQGAVSEVGTTAATTFAGDVVKLTANLTFADGQYWYYNDGTTVHDYRINNFAGTFDGQEKTIKNLTFLHTAGTNQNVGLFSKLAADGAVNNLTFDTVTGTFSDELRYGTVAATLDGDVDNCHLKNINITVSDGVFRGAALGYSVGNSDGSNITDCTLDGFNVENKASDGVITFSGLLGTVKAGTTVTGCTADNITLYAKKEIQNAGGLIGIAKKTTVKDCSVSSVSIISGYRLSYTGGLAGQFGTGNGASLIENCTAEDITISGVVVKRSGGNGEDGTGGFIGAIETGTIVKKCSIFNVSLTVTEDGNQIGGFVGNVNIGEVIDCSADVVNITISGVGETVGAGCVGGFAGQTRAGTTAFDNCILTNLNIVVKENAIIPNIGGFVGNIDGTDATFVNCSANGTIDADSASFSEEFLVGGFASNLGWGGSCAAELDGCVADVDIETKGVAGGFLGVAQDNGSGSSLATVTISNSSATGDVTSTSGVAGGFIGTGSRGTFENCEANGNVSGYVAGGFVGTITPNTSTADEKSLTISDSSVNGTVTGSTIASGFVGTITASAENDTNATSVTIENCIATPDVYSENGTTVEFATETVPNGSTNHLVSSGNAIRFNKEISITADNGEYVVNENILISVNIVGDGSFNACELEMSYPSDLVTFNESESILNGAQVTAENGVLKLVDYGATQNYGNGVYVLAFTAQKGGSANISLISAGFGTIASAETDNLAIADCSEVSITVEVKNSVEIDSIFAGASSIVNGQNYTFSKEITTGAYYDYGTPTATIDGLTVAVVANADGTWTVENVTGDLVISGTRTPKTHNVTINGDNEANAGVTATYGTDYTFTLADDIAAGLDVGYNYAVESITINGNPYTSYSVADRVCTIIGTDIIGDVVITISKTEVAPNQFSVTMTGSGVGAATLSTNVVDINNKVSLTITPDAGYVYTVTADGYEVTADGNVYTISNVTTTVEFTVERTVDVSNASVGEYVTLDGSKMWLVKMENVIEGSVYTYNEQTMFWSEQYNAYVTLVVSSETPAIESENFAIITGTATVLSSNMDVNMSGTVDANDAQLVWNMYNAQYSDFTTTVTMEKFLRADVSGDGKVDTQDAAAIVSFLLS